MVKVTGQLIYSDREQQVSGCLGPAAGGVTKAQEALGGGVEGMTMGVVSRMFTHMNLPNYTS